MTVAGLRSDSAITSTRERYDWFVGCWLRGAQQPFSQRRRDTVPEQRRAKVVAHCQSGQSFFGLLVERRDERLIHADVRQQSWACQ
jgi:hypothetical protein